MEGNIWYAAGLLITALFSGMGGGWLMRRRQDNRADQAFQRAEYQLIIAELKEEHRLTKASFRREIEKLGKVIDKAKQEAEEYEAERLAEVVGLRDQIEELKERIKGV